jgi:hypothetical protein
MSNYNLPPGCTDADIDRAAGAYEEKCRRCDDPFEARDLNDVGLCDRCAEEESTCGPECTCRSCQIERDCGDHPFAG